ncbi:MAG: peptide ligase PGM1-related protein [Nocardioidaceae bacterium]
MPYDPAKFRDLQARLAEWWPVLTVRTIPERPRVLVMITSITLDLPPELQPLLPAFEERYLAYLMALARAEHTRLVYVTSMPVLPRLATYHLELVRGVDAVRLAERLTVVSIGDPSLTPLARKILDRPRLQQRLRDLIGDPRYGLLMPFIMTELEAELAVNLGIPAYGPDPALAWLGTKSGSRDVFAATGVPMPRGASGLRDRDDVVAALLDLQREQPVRRAVVKIDAGFSGLGNATVDLDGCDDRARVEKAVDGLRPEDPSRTAESFLDAFAGEGGVAEEMLEGDEVASPSVQLRASPLHDLEVLSTHDQVMSRGQVYAGCRFPARSAFVAPISTLGRRVAGELSRRGVIGRFGVDFVMVRRGWTWSPYALEVNLRNGGTTHPMITLLALTDGAYDEATGCHRARTGPKCYTATDHLARPEYSRLTPDDVLDAVADSGLAWDRERETGVALHMVSTVAVAGSVGATAIADTPDAADHLMRQLRLVLDQAAGVGPLLGRAP